MEDDHRSRDRARDPAPGDGKFHAPVQVWRNLKNEVNMETILRELGEFRAEQNRRLEELEKG
jgi:hypothetical protein